MATIDGARAMGLEREIGSLETGKRADLVGAKTIDTALDAKNQDLASAIVYSAQRRCSDHDYRWS